jgi:hypothetical protein
MLLHRPQAPKPHYHTVFCICRRIGDWLVIMERVRYLYEEFPGGKYGYGRWRKKWIDYRFDHEEPLHVEHGDIEPDC